MNSAVQSVCDRLWERAIACAAFSVLFAVIFAAADERALAFGAFLCAAASAGVATGAATVARAFQ